MNGSFGSLRLVNSYGAFGSVTKVRHEIVLQGTRDDAAASLMASPSASPSAATAAVQWEDYEFRCKPGGLDRPPCVLGPYHLRLDWLMWFAPFAGYQEAPWVVHLVKKLLQGDASVRALLARDPFMDDEGGRHDEGPSGGDAQGNQQRPQKREPPRPPAFIRAAKYRYSFTPGGPSGRDGAAAAAAPQDDEASGGGGHAVEVGRWWTREYVGEWLPPLELGNPSMERFLESHHMA